MSAENQGVEIEFLPGKNPINWETQLIPKQESTIES